jgi:catechol 2,3-dioxygenase-like lactoylglutathione lyase family enzyme
MSLEVTSIMIGVQDLARSKAFYVDGLGCAVQQDYPHFVHLDLGHRSSALAIYQWDAAAADAGVPPEGSGFRGVSFHFIVDAEADVDEAMKNAVTAGATVVKDAAAAQWGGYFGYFADPDGYLWKVATNA